MFKLWSTIPLAFMVFLLVEITTIAFSVLSFYYINIKPSGEFTFEATFQLTVFIFRNLRSSHKNENPIYPGAVVAIFFKNLRVSSNMLSFQKIKRKP